MNHTCPRRGEGPQYDVKDADSYRSNVCSYCGSLHPNIFMAALEVGGAELTPTDKNYKVYIQREAFGRQKFYFQHLSEEQMIRFVELSNARELKLSIPGHFYVRPFFMAPVVAGRPVT